MAVFSTPLNSFNVTPKLTQAAILQKPEKESSTPPPAVNPAFLTPPPTVETPSQVPKRKRSRIQFVNYLADVNGDYGKQKKRTRHKKFRVSCLVLLRAFIICVFQLILLKFFNVLYFYTVIIQGSTLEFLRRTNLYANVSYLTGIINWLTARETRQ